MARVRTTPKAPRPLRGLQWICIGNWDKSLEMYAYSKAGDGAPKENLLRAPCYSVTLLPTRLHIFKLTHLVWQWLWIESKYHRKNRGFWINIGTQHNKNRALHSNWVGFTIHNCVLSGTLIFTPRLRFLPGSSLTRNCAKILKHSRLKRNMVTISHTTYPLFMTFLTDSDVFVSLFFCRLFSVMTRISECFWTILSNSSKQKSISSNRNLILC